jgi:hypothetical protein
MITIILCVTIILMLITLFWVQVTNNKTLYSKVEIIEVSTSFLEKETKTRNAEYKAKKEWKGYRERNLPRTEAPRTSRPSMSSEEMMKQADRLEQELQA